MRLVTGIAAALLLTMPANAGDWQPNPNVRYELRATAEQLPEETPSELKWVETLLRNLRESGAHPNVVFRFAKVQSQLRVNGALSDGGVYVLRGSPEVFLVLDPSNRYQAFLVDFKRSTVEVTGWGEQLHVPRSRRFCVAVFDGPNWLGGIPVTDGTDNPNFRDQVVSWQ